MNSELSTVPSCSKPVSLSERVNSPNNNTLKNTEFFVFFFITSRMYLKNDNGSLLCRIVLRFVFIRGDSLTNSFEKLLLTIRPFNENY